MTDIKKKKSHTFALVIIALVTLFNPNINLIDLIPDFIGYYILSRIFLRPSFSCPYFEEARRGFTRLFWLSLAKIPAIIAMVLIRASNTQDNDIVALMALIFCILELIMLIPTVKNAFEALIYLAGRQGLDSVLGEGKSNSTSAVRSLTVIYFIFKCLAYTLPEFLRLTRIMDIGNQEVVATGSNLYPFAVVGLQLIGYAFGTVWLIKAIGYVKSIRNEGKFYSAITAQEEGSEDGKYQRAIDKSRRKTAHFMLILFALSSFDLIFDNYRGINLLPSFLSGIILIIAICKLMRSIDARYASLKRISLISAILFSIASVISYWTSIAFLTKYDLTSLYNKIDDAVSLYSTYEILSFIELLCYAFMLTAFTLLMRVYIKESFGIKIGDSRYGSLEAEYHRSLTVKSIVFSSIALIGAIAKYISLIFNGNPSSYESGSSDTLTVIIGSSAPWLSIVTVGITILLSLYAVYLCGIFNQEMNDEYSK